MRVSVIDTLRRVARWLDGVGSSRRFVAGVLLAALGVFGIESLAWPLMLGRDGTTYLMYYADMWHAHASFPELMLFRTPLAPLLYGPLLHLGGAALAEAGAAVYFAVAVAALTLAAAAFGGLAAVVTAAALLLYPGYGGLFHQVSSDPAFALVFALWTFACVRVVQRPTLRRFAGVAVLTFLMVMARPSAQTFALFILVPLVMRAPWQARLRRTASFALPLILLLVGWAALNDVRYGDFTVARSGGAQAPFYRVFVFDHLVGGDNGPASRRLAALVKTRLLPLPQYRDAGIRTTADFFARGEDHAWGDLVVLSDRVWGWNSDYSTLRRAGLEAIEHHRTRYAHRVAAGVWYELHSPYKVSAPTPAAAAQTPPTTAVSPPSAAVDRTDPGGILWWLATTPDGHITAHNGKLIWSTPAGQRHYQRLVAFVDRLQSDLPNRNGSHAVARVLNGIASVYPWLAAWLLLGLAAPFVRRAPWMLAALPAFFGLLLVVTTMAAMPPGLAYVVPVAPGFVLFGVVGLCGRRAWVPAHSGREVARASQSSAVRSDP